MMAGRDEKREALRASRTLNPRPETVGDEEFASCGFFDPRDSVQVKYEMVRKARVGGVGVSRAAAAFGLSRPSFYAAAKALDSGGLQALIPAKPGPRHGHKLTDEVVAFAQGLRQADPGLRPADLASRIEARFGVRVHPRSVERALGRASKSAGPQ
jgi:transposase